MKNLLSYFHENGIMTNLEPGKAQVMLFETAKILILGVNKLKFHTTI